MQTEVACGIVDAPDSIMWCSCVSVSIKLHPSTKCKNQQPPWQTLLLCAMQLPSLLRLWDWHPLWVCHAFVNRFSAQGQQCNDNLSSVSGGTLCFWHCMTLVWMVLVHMGSSQSCANRNGRCGGSKHFWSWHELSVGGRESWILSLSRLCHIGTVGSVLFDGFISPQHVFGVRCQWPEARMHKFEKNMPHTWHVVPPRIGLLLVDYQSIERKFVRLVPDQSMSHCLQLTFPWPRWDDWGMVPDKPKACHWAANCLKLSSLNCTLPIQLWGWFSSRSWLPWSCCCSLQHKDRNRERVICHKPPRRVGAKRRSHSRPCHL